ncbi:MAG: hypothetical protein ABIW38_13410 [Ferruginibacter sp.]
MKSITGRLAGSGSLFLFPMLFLYQKKKKYLLLLIFPVLAISSCYLQYFKTDTRKQVDQDLLQNLQSMNKYFIVHYKDGVYALSNVTVKENIISADKSAIAPEHILFMNPDTLKTNRVDKSDKKNVLMEVHLYTDKNKTEETHLSLPLGDIKRADIYTVDKKATSRSAVLSTVAISVIGTFALLAIVTAIACNCPQVYIENNGASHFNGGMYSGAVYASLERTDYMPLGNLIAENNKLKFTINNAPEEEQFINKVFVIKADHAKGTEVLADRHGQLYSYTNVQSPLVAKNNNGKDIKYFISEKDGDHYGFNDDTQETFSNVILSFKKPTGAKNAKFVISGKNSMWSGYIYKNFNSLFGEGMEAWRKRQDNANPKDMEDWQQKQALPLMVYIKKEGQWVAVDYFSTPGNTAQRDMIMNIDISSIKTDNIELKLETAYRFWDIDYAAMDFSESNILKTELINPSMASKLTSLNEKDNLLANDKQYCKLTGDEFLNLEFNVDAVDTEIQHSYFLSCSGYYHSLVNYTGKPNTLLLMNFKKSGAFSNYSRARYVELNNELKKNMVVK